MAHIREFELFEDEGMVCAAPFGLEGARAATTSSTRSTWPQPWHR